MTETRKALSKRERKKLMDGARFWSDIDLPEDYMTDPKTGLRPTEMQPPQGQVVVRLGHPGVATTCILPTRENWRAGRWLTNDHSFIGRDDYYTWVVAGEGTPGNYLERHYILPDDKASGKTPPTHPADWRGQSKKADTGTSSGTSSYSTANTTKAPALPYGLRFQCPGCGHWYKESELKAHTQVCPKADDEAGWAIECSCPCPSLDETAKCKPGFPKAKPATTTATEVPENTAGSE